MILNLVHSYSIYTKQHLKIERLFCFFVEVHRSLSRKTATTSLWKRKPTSSVTTSAISHKRKCMTTIEQNDTSNNNERNRKKSIQRNLNFNTQSNNHGNGKRLRLNNDSSNIQTDETTYCLCSRV